jgi:hypothetical protein
MLPITFGVSTRFIVSFSGCHSGSVCTAASAYCRRSSHSFAVPLLHLFETLVSSTKVVLLDSDDMLMLLGRVAPGLGVDTKLSGLALREKLRALGLLLLNSGPVGDSVDLTSSIVGLPVALLMADSVIDRVRLVIPDFRDQLSDRCNTI